MSLLETRNLTVNFGGVIAVNDVSLSCAPGQLTGLIGPNGAGKTTFVDAVTGFLPDNARGDVLFDGANIDGLAPHKVAHAGLTRTWQSLELFDDITVRSNLDVASTRLTPAKAVRDYFGGTKRDERIEATLARLGLESAAESYPSDLSQGQRKLVGVARALVADAKMLVLDEPAAGLDKVETVWFGDQLRTLVDEGVPMLLIDHDMSLVLRVCDVIQVLEYGSLIASGTPESIRNNPDVIHAYLGSTGADR